MQAKTKRELTALIRVFHSSSTIPIFRTQTKTICGCVIIEERDLIRENPIHSIVSAWQSISFVHLYNTTKHVIYDRKSKLGSFTYVRQPLYFQSPGKLVFCITGKGVTVIFV